MIYRFPVLVAILLSGVGATVLLALQAPDSALPEPTPQQLPTPGLYPASNSEQFSNGQFSPNGQFFAARSSSFDGASRTFYVWDILSQSSPRLFGRWRLDHLEEFAIAPHQPLVAVITGERQRFGIERPYAVELRDLRTGRVGRTLMRGNSILSGIYSLAWSANGHLLATGGGDGLARIWNTQTGQRLVALKVGGSVKAVQFSPDGTSLAVVGGGKRGVQIWDFQRNVLLRNTSFAAYQPNLKFSPNGKILAVSHSNSEVEPIRLLDMAGFSAPLSVASPTNFGFPYHAPAIAFSRNNRWLAIANPPYIEVKKLDSQQVVARVKALQRPNTRLVTLQFMPTRLTLRWVTFQVGVDENNRAISTSPQLWQTHIIPNLT